MLKLFVRNTNVCQRLAIIVNKIVYLNEFPPDVWVDVNWWLIMYGMPEVSAYEFRAASDAENFS